MECKLRCVNFRRVSDDTRAFWPTFGVTEISDDWYRSNMVAIVISLGPPWSSGENFGCTWEYLGAQATCLGAPATSLGAPATSLGAPTTCLGAPTTSLGALKTSLGAPETSLGAHPITVEQSGKNNIFFGNTAGAPGNHSYYLSSNHC